MAEIMYYVNVTVFISVPKICSNMAGVQRNNFIGAGDINISGNKFEEYKHDSNEVIHFKLVRQASDIFDSSKEFKPDMSHQLFGDSERIFGYKDLRVEMFCTAAQMKTYVNVKFTDKVCPEKCDGLQADDVMKVLNNNLQPGYFTNLDEFIACLSSEANFKPFGELVHACSVEKDGKKREFEIYKHSVEAPGFRNFHERIQPFLLFYVDAASYIDIDDDKWMFFLVYEKYTNEQSAAAYAFVGYMTVYNYFAYPEKIRPRISQVLILPPFQRMGLCATLMQIFYNDCFTRSDVLDITVEDPSEGFQRVRDFVDTRNCSKLVAFQADNLRTGFSESMAVEAREKYKINKRQARRVYEILRLQATDCSNKEDLKSYRIDVKRRLNQPFQKNGRVFTKLKNTLNSTELAATLDNLTSEQRMDYLDKEYQELVDVYRQIINRLNTE